MSAVELRGYPVSKVQLPNDLLKNSGSPVY